MTLVDASDFCARLPPRDRENVIQLRQVKARVARLQELTQGLAKEVNAWKGRQGPLLPQERKRYLDALQDGLAGLEEARNVLVGVAWRLEREAARRPSA